MSKEAGQYLAFASMFLAFFLVLLGQNMQAEVVYGAGFFIMIVALLYSPFYVFVIKRKTDKER